MHLFRAWESFFGLMGFLRRNRRQRKAAIAKRRNLRRRHRMEALEQRVVLNADAVDDSLDTGYESPIVISAGQLTDNDSFSGTPTVTPNFGTTAQGGTLSDNGDGTYTYTPPSGFYGTDTFDYTLDDEDPSSDSATVSINVSDPPRRATTRRSCRRRPVIRSCRPCRVMRSKNLSKESWSPTFSTARPESDVRLRSRRQRHDRRHRRHRSRQDTRRLAIRPE
ncbi:MAG: Ig-like domain-containing protein [Pirellulales bacterium]